jgi:hypothetical protein
MKSVTLTFLPSVGRQERLQLPPGREIYKCYVRTYPTAGWIPEARLHNFLSVGGHAGSQKGPAAMQPAQGPSQRKPIPLAWGVSIAINDPFSGKSILK